MAIKWLNACYWNGRPLSVYLQSNMSRQDGMCSTINAHTAAGCSRTLGNGPRCAENDGVILEFRCD